GKDILKFHAVIWPAMLMALDLPLPGTVFAHGWWTVEGNKMSKSLGNVVDPHEVVDEWGVDAFRFFLLRQVAFGQDGNFSRELFKERYNSELANELGNLLSRVLGMIEKYSPEASPPETGEFKNQVEATLEAIEGLYARAAFNEVLDKIWEIVRKANSYVEEKKPWVLAKNNSRELCAVLGNLFRMLRVIAGLIYPFMPVTAKNMLTQMGVDEEALNTVEWKKEVNLKNVKKGEPLFLKK
ncbi:MAG: class I tRNA ligase family protein, partial [Elusimicrobiota bacterium]